MSPLKSFNNNLRTITTADSLSQNPASIPLYQNSIPDYYPAENYKRRKGKKPAQILLFGMVHFILLIFLIKHRRKTSKDAEIIRLYTSDNDHLRDMLGIQETKEKELKTILDDHFHLSKALTDIYYQYGHNSALFYKRTSELFNKDNINAYLLRDIRGVTNIKHDGLIDKLKHDFPHLTKGDLMMCCMICAGFAPDFQTMRCAYYTATPI